MFPLVPYKKIQCGRTIMKKRKLIPMIGLNPTDCHDRFDAFADTVCEKKFQFSNFVSWHFTSGQIIPGDEKLYSLCRVSIYHKKRPKAIDTRPLYESLWVIVGNAANETYSVGTEPRTFAHSGGEYSKIWPLIPKFLLRIFFSIFEAHVLRKPWRHSIQIRHALQKPCRGFWFQPVRVDWKLINVYYTSRLPRDIDDSRAGLGQTPQWLSNCVILLQK